MPHKPAVQSNPLKDQAPLFPENYNLSTPRRKEKLNLIFQRRDQAPRSSASPLAVARGGPALVDDDDDDGNHYLTMHPLNNVKLRAPRSILSAQPNQLALNVSINRGKSRHYVSSLDKTSLCDCFSYILRRSRRAQRTAASDDNKAVAETTSHSATELEAEADVADEAAMHSEAQRDEEYGRNSNTFCHCVTVPIRHSKFKLLRVDLLFDPREYAQIVGAQPAEQQLVALNVLLHDHESRIWSGVQMASIRRKSGFLLIPRLSVQCNQTLLGKAVAVVGSMAWRLSDEATESEADAARKWYPYRCSSVSEMIAVLTQQRLDIVDSYDTVLQQRNTAMAHGVDDADGAVLARNAPLNQVHPKQNGKDLAADAVLGDPRDAEQRPLAEAEPIEQGDAEMARRAQIERRRCPAAEQSDGGSNVPTKRSELAAAEEVAVAPRREQSERKKDNVLLTTASAPKHPGIVVEEMEKHMLNEEVARIESMIMGLEAAEAAIHRNDVDHRRFDELTASLSSSMMFSTKELNRARSKISDHLTKEPQHGGAQPLIPNEKPVKQEAAKGEEPQTKEKAKVSRAVPVCLSCQRCSRTIMLCQRQ